jgi:tetratricopeptide (TPR) repeat protein
MWLRHCRQQKLDAAICRGRQLRSEDRDQENLEFLEEARLEFPEEAEFQLLYATILLTSRPEDVASEVVKAVGIAPDDPTVLVRAAHLMRSEGEPEVAQFYMKRARELAGPDFIFEGGLANLEGIYAAFDKEYDLAEERLRLAVELDPDFESFAEDLARFLAARGRLAEALGMVDQALPRVKTKSYLEDLRERLVAAIDSARDS